MNNVLYLALYDIFPFIILLKFILCQFKLRFTPMAYKYIRGHIFHFGSSFIGIYVGIGIYFEWISNCIPQRILSTGVPLAIYLIFIGVLIDIVHKYFDYGNEHYRISKSELVFIMCTCMVILCIIGYFDKSAHTFEIIAILLGKFFWIDTGVGKIKNTDDDKTKKGFLRKIKEEVTKETGKVKSRIKEIAILMIIGELTYYIVKIILEKYFISEMNLTIVCILSVVIGLLIILYGMFIKYREKLSRISKYLYKI